MGGVAKREGKEKNRQDIWGCLSSFTRMLQGTEKWGCLHDPEMGSDGHWFILHQNFPVHTVTLHGRELHFQYVYFLMYVYF